MGYLERSGFTSLFIWRSVQATKTFSLSYLLTFVSREYDSIFKQLAVLESEEISSVTGCLKPCHYKKYILLDERSATSFKSDHYIFSLWAVSRRRISSTRCQPWWRSLGEPWVFSSVSLSFAFGTTLTSWRGWWQRWVQILALDPHLLCDVISIKNSKIKICVISNFIICIGFPGRSSWLPPDLMQTKTMWR